MKIYLYHNGLRILRINPTLRIQFCFENWKKNITFSNLKQNYYICNCRNYI